MCVNSILLKAFGPTREAVNGGIRKLHNGEFLSMFSSSEIINSKKNKRSVKFGERHRNRALF